MNGYVNYYLGIILEYSTKGQVEVSITQYRKIVLDEFPEKITTTAPTPATENLFKVRGEKDARPLSEKKLHNSITLWHSFFC